MGLSDRERILMIRLADLIITRVWQTDGRTDGIGGAYTRYSYMLSHVTTKHGVDRMHRLRDIAFKLYCDLEIGMRGHLQLSNAALSDRTHPVKEF